MSLFGLCLHYLFFQLFPFFYVFLIYLFLCVDSCCKLNVCALQQHVSVSFNAVCVLGVINDMCLSPVWKGADVVSYAIAIKRGLVYWR